MEFGEILSLLDATLRLSTPLLLACLAGMYSERSGVFDIGLEGKMLAAAFAAAATAAVTGSMWLGLAAGLAISLMTALLQGAAAITLRGNQLIAGVAINMLAAGMTTFLGQQWFRQGGRTPALGPGARFETITLPFADELAGVPILGPIYQELISGHYLLVYVAFLAVPVTAFVLFRTRFGLRLRAVGENPKAVDTAGISSPAALRGGDGHRLPPVCRRLSLHRPGLGLRQQHDRRPCFIALAALIFAMAAGAGDVHLPALRLPRRAQIRLQGRSLPVIGECRCSSSRRAHILTVVLLAGFIGKAVGPKAGGVPYVKER